MQRALKQSLNQAGSLREAESGMLYAEKSKYALAAAPATLNPGGGFAGGGFAGGGAGIGGAGMMGRQQGPLGQNSAQGQSQSGISGTGGSMGGLGGPMAQSVGRSNGAASADPMGADPATKIRRVGTKTFYRKSGRWVDAAVKPEDDVKAITVEQFGDAFFKLAAQQTADQNQFLAFDEPVTVRIAGQVYRIDPPKQVK